MRSCGFVKEFVFDPFFEFVRKAKFGLDFDSGQSKHSRSQAQSHKRQQREQRTTAFNSPTMQRLAQELKQKQWMRWRSLTLLRSLFALPFALLLRPLEMQLSLCCLPMLLQARLLAVWAEARSPAAE